MPVLRVGLFQETLTGVILRGKEYFFVNHLDYLTIAELDSRKPDPSAAPWPQPKPGLRVEERFALGLRFEAGMLLPPTSNFSANCREVAD
jgi:hypothetical protein